MTIPVDVQVIIERFINHPGIRLPDLPAGRLPPTIATVREIDIRVAGGSIQAKYTKANYEVELSDFGGFEALLQLIAEDGLPMPDSASPKSPFKTSLSLQNEKYCFVIFVLTRKNWQFSRTDDPVSVGIEGFDPEPCYFAARRVDEHGNIVPQSQVRDDCKIAYFIADGITANSGTTGDYTDSFNLHLEVLDRDSGGNVSPVPVIIDPDVRYPGGSGVDGGP